MDGLSRIVSACEGTYFERSEGTHFNPCFPYAMLDGWIAAADATVLHDRLSLEEQGTLAKGWTLPQRLRRLYGSNAIGLLVGKGLEAWADPRLAANFMHEILGNVGMEDFDSEYMNHTVQSWSGDWADRAKADVFLDVMEMWSQSYEFRGENGERMTESDEDDEDDY